MRCGGGSGAWTELPGERIRKRLGKWDVGNGRQERNHHMTGTNPSEELGGGALTVPKRVASICPVGG